MDVLTIGSLFSGIGGLELGVEHATGGRVVFHVERDAWCREVLAKHWPDAVRYDDVCTVTGLPRVDILCGGFPCQDVSVAGKRAGFSGERSSLWREYRRIVADVGPRFVFVENVPGLLSADGGHAFAEVLGDLASLRFDAEWDVFRASDVDAPHRRERLFLLAYRNSCGREGWSRQLGSRGIAQPTNGSATVADAHGERCELQRVGGLLDGERPTLRHDADGRDAALPGVAAPDVSRLEERRRVAGDGREELAPAERGSTRRESGRGALAGVGAVPDGVSRRLDEHRWPARRGEPQHPWEPSRTARSVPDRRAQLTAYGNAVVPQVAALAWRVLYARAVRAVMEAA